MKNIFRIVWNPYLIDATCRVSLFKVSFKKPDLFDIIEIRKDVSVDAT